MLLINRILNRNVIQDDAANRFCLRKKEVNDSPSQLNRALQPDITSIDLLQSSL